MTLPFTRTSLNYCVFGSTPLSAGIFVSDTAGGITTAKGAGYGHKINSLRSNHGPVGIRKVDPAHSIPGFE